MTKYLCYMRHGATELNVADAWQGRADSPLTELGRRQAAEAGDHIRESALEFDHIYCSPRGRVVETLQAALPEIVARGAFEFDLGLLEMSFGEADGMLHAADDPKSPYFNLFEKIGGDSESRVEVRICEAAERFMAADDAHDVLVVSHGTCGRIFRNHWAENARVEAPRYLANCSLYTYEFDEATRGFSLVDIFEPASATNPEDFIAAPAVRARSPRNAQ